MVQKAKRRLTIALTLAVLSIVFFIIIGMLGTTYFTNLRQDREDLETISKYAYDQPKIEFGIEPPEFRDEREGFNSLENFEKKKLPKRQYFYFTVKDEEIINYHTSMPNFEMMFSQEVIEKSNFNSYIDIVDIETLEVLTKNNSSGKINYDGSYFLFDSLQNDDEITYYFLDTTMTNKYFRNSISVGGLILFLSLIYILLISRTVLNKALDPLEISIENQKRFTGDASHELRTPLTAIRSNLDILINYDLPKSEQEVWLNNISNEIDRMTRLTGDLLSLSRNDTIVKEKSKFYLAEIFDSLYFNFQNLCILNIEGGDFEIYAVKEEILQLLIIFIDNAIKYNSKKEKIVTIKSKIEKGDKFFVFLISDNGDGIESDRYEEIFERFYREDKVRNSETNGFGLGLSIAKNIIKDYNGKIKVQSEIDKGTTFKLTLANKK